MKIITIDYTNLIKIDIIFMPAWRCRSNTSICNKSEEFTDDTLNWKFLHIDFLPFRLHRSRRIPFIRELIVLKRNMTWLISFIHEYKVKNALDVNIFKCFEFSHSHNNFLWALQQKKEQTSIETSTLLAFIDLYYFKGKPNNTFPRFYLNGFPTTPQLYT